MATTINLASTPHVGSIATPATTDTSLTAPTNVATVFTAGANGSQIFLARICQIATTAAGGCVNLFLFDGTNYHFWDNYIYGALTLSATSEALPVDIPYAQLVMQTGWSLRTTDTAAGGTAHFNVVAIGGDF